jgi:hypothetical protein
LIANDRQTALRALCFRLVRLRVSFTLSPSDKFCSDSARRPAEGMQGGADDDKQQIYRPRDLVAARAGRLNRNASPAMALAPLICALRDRGKSISAIAAELTQLDIEISRVGAQWAWKSMRRLFNLTRLDLPPI